ncbi:MAG: glycoside hydrolase [Methylocystaceae bacterium]|nr:MAG: glycoside hydrolase [Methylocystaceae bacterium]
MKDMNIESEIDYFSTWKTRQQNFDSYYFAAYDKQSGGGCPNNDDADRHFGLCSESGLTKDVRLMKCK